MHKHKFVWRCTMNYFNLQKKTCFLCEWERIHLHFSSHLCVRLLAAAGQEGEVAASPCPSYLIDFCQKSPYPQSDPNC